MVLVVFLLHGCASAQSCSTMYKKKGAPLLFGGVGEANRCVGRACQSRTDFWCVRAGGWGRTGGEGGGGLANIIINGQAGAAPPTNIYGCMCVPAVAYGSYVRCLEVAGLGLSCHQEGTGGDTVLQSSGCAACYY